MKMVLYSISRRCSLNKDATTVLAWPSADTLRKDAQERVPSVSI